MNNKILSIIIPAYNVESYIEKCLNSVTHNIKNIDDIEIIVINDGSTDNTLKLAEKYAFQYPHSVRVIDKPNGGWGTGINKGIEEATGKYLKTLDSDDWYNSENLDNFINLLKQINVDMVLTSFSEITLTTTRVRNMPKEFCEKVTDIDEYLTNNNFNLNAPIHAITYKTTILKDSKWKVAEKYYGDLDYIIAPLIHVKTMYLSTLNIYQYFLGREGQSVSIKGYNAHIDDYLTVCNKTILFWIDNENKISKPLRQLIQTSTIERIRWAYILLMSPTYSGNKLDSKRKLSKLDETVKKDKNLYHLTNQIKYKQLIPWIYIWRKTKINLFKLYKI